MKKKVLIIENDQDIQSIIAYVLSEQGFETLSIPQIHDLLAILSFAPDVILVDEFINGRSGQRLCNKIKQIHHLSTTPVIVLSTADDIELIAAECEADDYICKSFEIDEIVHKVMRLVNFKSFAD